MGVLQRLAATVLLCAVGISPSCGAQPTADAARPAAADSTASIDSSRRTAIVEATERVAPAVVSIIAVQTRLVRGRGPARDDIFDLFFRDFLPPTHVYRERVPSLGSGVIVRASGVIVTNSHVVRDADEIQVTLPTGEVLPAVLAADHPPSDVAVLQVTRGGLPAATLGSSRDLLVGEWAIAVGNPFGHLISDAEPTVTVGVISAKRRSFLPKRAGEQKYIDMIQTDAAINPGNSGGALANASGEVVGINTFILSRSGGSMGLGFAIPIDHVKRVLREYEAHGTVREVWLGFTIGAITPQIQQALGLSDAVGVVVVEVYRQGPAYAAGLRPGDVIRSINDRAVADSEDAQLALGYVFAGDTFEMDLRRSAGPKRISMEARVAK